MGFYGGKRGLPLGRYIILLFTAILVISTMPQFQSVAYAAGASYSATIWAWDTLDTHGWIAEPITMDGGATGFSTPHNFTGLSGTHKFTVPSTDVDGRQFTSWDTAETSTTLTVTSGGIHTAQYASYVATIEAYDPLGGTWSQIPEPITMDGASTGYSTPHPFTGLTGSHTFTAPVPLYDTPLTVLSRPLCQLHIQLLF
jgi:hypothetical protein